MSEIKENVQNLKKPEWIRSKLPIGEEYTQIKSNLRSKNLFTVCEEAKCPNLSDCWSKKTATMMILGDTCTRACKFCHIKTGNPKAFLDPNEVENATKMVEVMDLKYLVITSVDRDDLPDLGAGRFAEVVSAVNNKFPNTKVEVLIPDFCGIPEHMHTLAKSNPFVIAQNLETVKRLTHVVRDRRAGYEQTLNALKFYADNYPDIVTKSSLMVGLGETEVELIEAMKDLKAHGVRVLTIGQYLRPNMRLLPVIKYYHPDEFKKLEETALSIGFEFVASGPMVRSSYRAVDYLKFLENKKA